MAAKPNTRFFRDQLRNFILDARLEHTRWCLKVAEAAQRAAYEHTPIDTSRAMSGWTSQVGKPFLREPDFTPGAKGSTRAEAMQLNEQNIKETAASYKFGRKIFIRNNVPYIESLEDGSSKQAPSGMMEFALAAAEREMK